MPDEHGQIRRGKLAPCGVFCGACPSFYKSCLGCASDNKNQKRGSKWKCNIRICCFNIKGLSFCFECEDFPCKIYSKKLLTMHKGDPRFTYRFELPVVFNEFKRKGIDNFYSSQNERWKCDCGGTIRFYFYICDNCGKYKLVN